jgi:hypothetical protein
LLVFSLFLSFFKKINLIIGLELGELAPGKHRPLTAEEILQLENVCIHEGEERRGEREEMKVSVTKSTGQDVWKLD